MLKIVTDLLHLKQLPSSFKSLQKEHVQLLVNAWQKANIAEVTIAKRLSVLRHFLKLADLPIVLPANQALGIVLKKPITKTTRANLDQVIDTIGHQATASILGFERWFGLTRRESIRIDLDEALAIDKLQITRKVASNSKTRFIPLVADRQYHEIQFRQKVLNVASNMAATLAPEKVATMIRSLLSFHGFDPGLNGRDHYINWRYALLLQQGDKPYALAALQQELGLYSQHDLAQKLW